jgi:SAM-dependent methyltransferase
MKPIEYQRLFEAEQAQWWYVGMRAISLALLDGAAWSDTPTPRSFLDAGCGTGGMLEHLGQRGRAVGVDLADEALRLCRERQVRVARAELTRLPFAPESFDGVTSFDVIYHQWVVDDGAAVREMARVLRPGGVLLIRVPALEMLRGAHDEAVLGKRRYTRARLRRLLEESGLEVLRATYANAVLFPLALLRRSLDRLSGRQGSDVGLLPSGLEWLFRMALLAEARLIPHLSLPVGSSVVALARKPE